MTGYFDLNQQTYDWCVRVFDRAKSLLGVRIMMHHDGRQLEQGDIFLFNHFARAETFIPQYCIYQETGAFCRSIAAAEFFKSNDRFASMLRDVGAVPNDHPQLLMLLAIDILKGRKIIIFPEGGMVKDRQVLDERGDYNVYSRSSKERRKHHSGAARLAVGLQIFKQSILHQLEHSRRAVVERWAEQLGLPSATLLIERARRPVSVVPANITFYPLRVQDNFLRRGADMLFGRLSPRAIEELIVEGNLFFKATDMDIRLGEPISPAQNWEWWERLITGYVARGLPDLEAVFTHAYLHATPLRRIASKGLRSSIDRLRDRYMQEIYRKVTVNMSHLAASIVLQAAERGDRGMPLSALARLIYVSLKRLQPHRRVHLHRSLCNPAVYRKLLEDESPELLEFLKSAETAQLIALRGDAIEFLEKLKQDHEFDVIRLENPIEVYANEVEPIHEVTDAIAAAWREAPQLSARDLAEFAFADEQIALEWDRRYFSKPKYKDINARETATADPAPFLLKPAVPRPLGILLVHGFLASPAEVRGFAERLLAAGYTVLGVRLRGHGTSPWDLRERSWRDWLKSVTTGYDILRAYCDRICVIGFSTGGALTLAHAATVPAGLAGAVAIATPIKFHNKNMRFVPLVHGANQLVEWFSKYEGVMPFRVNDSEHPHINYRHLPIRGLYELTRMVAHVKKVLPAIACPVLVLQGTGEQVVDPKSATIVYDKLGSRDKQLHWIESKRHGILNEDIGETHAMIFKFLQGLETPLQQAKLS